MTFASNYALLGFSENTNRYARNACVSICFGEINEPTHYIFADESILKVDGWVVVESVE